MSRDDRNGEGMTGSGSDTRGESHVDAVDALELELSALLDGELEPEREDELRRRLASDAALAERFDSFRRLDAALRDLPARELPGDLHARLRERIAAEGARDERAAVPGSDSSRSRSSPPRRRGLRWGLPAAATAAVAAGLLLVVLREEPVVEDPVALRSPPPSDQALFEELVAAPDEDLAVALELETLSDLEIIEDLDLLELLIAAERPESGG